MTADAAAVAAALRDLAGDHGAVGVLSVGPATREDEHRAGRVAASAAVVTLGVPAPGVDAPSPWPPGVAGSISHHAGYAAAVAIRTPSGRVGMGVDIDRVGRLPVEDAAFVLDGDERAAAGAIGADLMVPWVVKEAVFKALSNATPGGLDDLDPRAVRVTVVIDGTADVAVDPVAGTVEVVGACWCVVDDTALAVVSARWTGP